MCASSGGLCGEYFPAMITPSHREARAHQSLRFHFDRLLRFRQRCYLTNRGPVSRRCLHPKLFLKKVVWKSEEAVLFPVTQNKRRSIPDAKYLQALGHGLQWQLRFAARLSSQEGDELHYVITRLDPLERIAAENLF